MAKTFDELHNERFGYNAASCTGYCANESKYSNYQYRREGYFLREAEVTALQAKLREAQAKMVEAFEFIGTRQDVDNGRLSESDCDDLAKILHIADGVTAVPMEAPTPAHMEALYELYEQMSCAGPIDSFTVKEILARIQATDTRPPVDIEKIAKAVKKLREAK